MWCFFFFRRSSLRRESHYIPLPYKWFSQYLHSSPHTWGSWSMRYHCTFDCTTQWNLGCNKRSSRRSFRDCCHNFGRNYLCTSPIFRAFIYSWHSQFSHIRSSTLSTKISLPMLMPSMHCWFSTSCLQPHPYSRQWHHIFACETLVFLLCPSISMPVLQMHPPTSHCFLLFWCGSCGRTVLDPSCGPFLMHLVHTAYLA